MYYQGYATYHSCPNRIYWPDVGGIGPCCRGARVRPSGLVAESVLVGRGSDCDCSRMSFGPNIR